MVLIEDDARNRISSDATHVEIQNKVKQLKEKKSQPDKQLFAFIVAKKKSRFLQLYAVLDSSAETKRQR